MVKMHKLTKGGQTIYPATITDAVVNPISRKSLTAELSELSKKQGNKILTWSVNVATTRKLVPADERKSGIQISYLVPDSGYVNEQYIGTAITDAEWIKDSNWEKIASVDDIYMTEKILSKNDYDVLSQINEVRPLTHVGGFSNYAIQGDGSFKFESGFQNKIYSVTPGEKYLAKIECNALDGNNKIIPYAFYSDKPSSTIFNVVGSVPLLQNIEGFTYYIIEISYPDAKFICIQTKGTTNIEFSRVADSYFPLLSDTISSISRRGYAGKIGSSNGTYPLTSFNFNQSQRSTYNTNNQNGIGNIIEHNGKIITSFISTNLNLESNKIYATRVDVNTGKIVRLKELSIKSKTLYNGVIQRDNSYYLYELEPDSYIINDDEQIAITNYKQFNAFSGRSGKIFNINDDLTSGNIEEKNLNIVCCYIYADDDLGFSIHDREHLSMMQNLYYENVSLNIVDNDGLKSKINSQSLESSEKGKRICPLFNMTNNVILGIYSESEEIGNLDISYGIVTKKGTNLFDFGEIIETVRGGKVTVFSRPVILGTNQYLYIVDAAGFGVSIENYTNTVPTLINNATVYSITDRTPNFALIQPVNDGIFGEPYEVLKQPVSGKRYLTLSLRVDCSNPIIPDYIPISPRQIQEQKIYDADAYVMLPYKYGLEGRKKYPLAFYSHAGNTSPTEIQNDQIAIYLCSIGYVVAGTTTPTEYANSLGVADRLRNAGNYACMNAYVQLYKHLVSNYRIDVDRVFAFGASQGGFTSLNLAEITNIPIKAISLNCPVLSMYYGQWFLDKDNVMAYYGFENNTIYDADKVIGYDPYIRNATDIFTDLSESAAPAFINGKTLKDVMMKRYTTVPIRMFAGTQDDSVGYTIHQIFAKAVKNAGGNISLTIWDGKGHMDSDVIGTVEYTGLDSKRKGDIDVTATAWETALWFSRFGGIEPYK